MNNKKMMALGMLAVAGAGMVTATPVNAAENMVGNGETTVTYTPGQSSGSDGSTISDWTVDYPVKINLNDTSVEATPVSSQFKLLNTDSGKATDAYTGGSTVTISLNSHDQQKGGNGIKLSDSTDTPQENVVIAMKAGSSGTELGTNGTSNEVAQLNSTTSTATLKTYLKNTAGVKYGESYSTTLTWTFTGNESTLG